MSRFGLFLCTTVLLFAGCLSFDQPTSPLETDEAQETEVLDLNVEVQELPGALQRRL
jgi:hypothetical protein